MDITITISEETEQIIRGKAEKNGKDVAEFVGEFIEDNFADQEKNEREQTTLSENQPERKFMRMQGMFSSGKPDTSERMHELLYEEDFDPAEGFSGR
jgi:rhamnose utilization protein RhaD (predicted bifunctional aldolase and dehydrogenase)